MAPKQGFYGSKGADQNRTGELALTRKERTFRRVFETAGLHHLDGRPYLHKTCDVCVPRYVEVSPREREDEERRAHHDDDVDPWGYDCWHEDGWTEV